ncbi:hypothetical protein SAMN05216215_1002108 [Saccharopolyspora shandongensis]|uniref:Short C-terminal domain-containing protein n=1 Tax=Saccharopolyspora shandongensis TaxID=418495 RepID=A0A1H2S527_9PSEU|nr:hypothetical protein SAMN05216215_1002108 [Saccharopolyspora shandongensis]
MGAFERILGKGASVTWQDELQNLDAELAAGRISAEEYRQRRDAVLGRAQNGQGAPASGGFPQQNPSSGGFPQQQPQAGPSSGGFPQQDPQAGPQSGGFPQQAGPSSGGFPQQQPPQQQQQSSPFPPAFSWGDAAQSAPQQQPQQQGGSLSEATQVVPNPLAQQQAQQQAQPQQQAQQAQPQQQAQQQQQVPPQSDSESTQVVSLSQQPQWGPPQPQWGPQQGWGPVETTGTPWGDDLPGTPEHGDASWMRQGPEVFETASKPGKGKLIAGLSIGGVLLVGLIVAGIFYFTSGGGTTPTEPTAAPPPPPVQTQELPAPPPAHPNPPASPQEVLVAAPGPAHPWSGPLDLPSLQGAKAGLLQPKAVLDSAIQRGLIDGWFNGAEGTPKTTLLALQLPDANAAKQVVDQYLGAQQGLSEVDDLSYQGVKVVNAGGVFRTAYVAHNWAIIIDATGPSDQKSAVKQSFKSTLDQQVNHLPPTVRD